MKQAKLYKVILFVAMMAMFIATALVGFSGNPVYALEGNEFFSGNNQGVSFENDNAVVSVKDGDTFTFKNDLVINDFVLNAKLGSGIESIKITFTTPTKYVNGNRETSEDTSKIIDKANHELLIEESTFDFDGATGISYTSGSDLTVKLVVESNILKASVNGSALSFYSIDTAHWVKNSVYTVASGFTLTFDLEDGTDSTTFELVSVGQKGDNSEYLQTFELEDEKIKTFAKPIVSAKEDLYVKLEYGVYDLMVDIGNLIDLDLVAYSVLDSDATNQLYIRDDGDTKYISTENKPQSVMFNDLTANTVTVMYGETVCETLTFDLFDSKSDSFKTSNEAPEFIPDTNALFIFNQKLQQATLQTGKDYCIRLGDDLKVPSFEDLVKDDNTPFSGLTATMYYRTPTKATSTQSSYIDIDAVGTYSFFVVFADKYGESMDVEDFYMSDEHKEYNPSMSEFIFTFEIEDNSPIEVNAVSQSKGYVGVTYNVSEFSITSSGYTPKYTLYYSSNINAVASGENWEDEFILIPAVSSITESHNAPSGYTVQSLKDFAYDGSLSFKPTAIGKYVVKCTVSSTASVRSSSAVAEILVESQPSVVKPDSHFIQNNLLSFIFLGVGTLCLIAIIVLLFVKPKDKANDED